MIPAILLFLLAAALDWVAVARGWRRVEYAAKPAALAVLLAWLALAGGFGSPALVCFGIGLFASLVGDVLLMVSYRRPSERWFLAGLAAFLVTNLAYLVGLITPLTQVSFFWVVGLGLVVALAASGLIRRVRAGVEEKGLYRLTVPVTIYGVVLTATLLAALLTLYRSDWEKPAAALAGLGAILFYASDVVLAWDKFIAPLRRARLINIVPYHLGQLALVAGVLLHTAG
jgi:uncharacterized membrane protein YhhN